LQIGHRFDDNLFLLRKIGLLPLNLVARQVQIQRIVQALAIAAVYDVVALDCIVQTLLRDFE